MYSDWISPVRRYAITARVGLAVAVASLALTSCLPATPPRMKSPSTVGLIQGPQTATTDLAVAGSPPIHAIAGPVPFPIEKNVGQASPGVSYVFRTGDVQVSFA